MILMTLARFPDSNLDSNRKQSGKGGSGIKVKVAAEGSAGLFFEGPSTLRLKLIKQLLNNRSTAICSTESRSTESRSTKSRSTESRSTESCSTESRSTESRSTFKDPSLNI